MAWNESLPAIRQPFKQDSILNLGLPTKQAEVSFSINRRGRVSSVDVLSAEPDDRSTRNEAGRAVRDLQFRPAIVEGSSKRLKDVQVLYSFTD